MPKSSFLHDLFQFQLVPPPPSKSMSEKALQPSPWRLDPIFWRKNYIPSPSDKNTIVEEIHKRIQNGRYNISYNVLVSTRYSPRRIPFIVQKPPTNLLLSEKELRAHPERFNLINLKRRLRPVLLPPPGYQTLDFDLDRAHLSIAASISQDETLLTWLKGDPHQHTGDLFAPQFAPQKRRQIGKSLNSALTMGAQVQGVTKILKEDHNVDCIDSSMIQTCIDSWWKRFPKLRALRMAFTAYIREIKERNGRYVLKYGRSFAYYDNAVLNGHIKKKREDRFKPYSFLSLQNSCWSALLTSYEAGIMEHILVAAYQHGLKLGAPIYDGAMWHVPEGTNTQPFEDDVYAILKKWKYPSGFTIKQL